MAKKDSPRRRLRNIVTTLVVAVTLLLSFVSWEEKNGGSGGLKFDLPGLLDTLTGEAQETQGGAPDPATPASGLPELEVHFINVGQAKAILVKAPGSSVLIDAGENGQGDQVIRYLNSAGVHSLDYAIGTHPHSDHIGGLDTVISKMKVKNVILPVIPDAIVPTTQTYTDLLYAIGEAGLKITPSQPGKVYNLGKEAKLTILGPVADYDDLNNMSIVCRLTYGGHSFLFTGDACTASENDIMDAGGALQSDVLDVGHHGSSSSTGKKFLDVVDPAISVISCGVDNSYGHPHREVMELLQARTEMDLYRTDRNGAVIIRSDGQTLTVETEK